MRYLVSLWLFLPAVAVAQESITHGPILGRPGAHHMGIWARTSQPGSFRVRYGLQPDKLDQLSAPAATTLEHDNTGWVLLQDLTANTKYYYQTIPAAGKAGPGGSFRTLPDAGDYRDAKLNPQGLFNFRFEFACGNNQNPIHGAGPANLAFKTMLDKLHDQVHFAILNGDWLYEEKRDHPPAAWQKEVALDRPLPHVVNVAPTIVGVWEN